MTAAPASTEPTATWPTITAATEVLPAGVSDDDHELWLTTRKDGLGGSDAAAVLGAHPFSSPYEVWLDKTGRRGPKDDTYLMARGRYFEPSIAQWFSDTTGLGTLRTGTWVNNDLPWARCNPDRLTSDGMGAEFKKVDSDWTDLWRYGPASYAYEQALWGCAVTGLPGWYVAADMNWSKATLPVWFVEADPEAIAYRLEFCDWWWHRYVKGDRPPPVDGSESTSTAIKDAFREPVYLEPMVILPGITERVTRLRDIKRQQKALKHERTKIENWIEAGLEHHEVACDEDGIPVMAWRPQTSTQADGTVTRYRVLREIK